MLPHLLLAAVVVGFLLAKCFCRHVNRRSASRVTSPMWYMPSCHNLTARMLPESRLDHGAAMSRRHGIARSRRERRQPVRRTIRRGTFRRTTCENYTRTTSRQAADTQQAVLRLSQGQYVNARIRQGRSTRVLQRVRRVDRPGRRARSDMQGMSRLPGVGIRRLLH